MHLRCVSRGLMGFLAFLPFALLWPTVNLITSLCLCLLRIASQSSRNPVGTVFVNRNYRAKEGAGFGVGKRWVGAEGPCLPQGCLCRHRSLAIPAPSQASLPELQVRGWGQLPHSPTLSVEICPVSIGVISVLRLTGFSGSTADPGPWRGVRQDAWVPVLALEDRAWVAGCWSPASPAGLEGPWTKTPSWRLSPFKGADASSFQKRSGGASQVSLSALRLPLTVPGPSRSGSRGWPI